MSMGHMSLCATGELPFLFMGQSRTMLYSFGAAFTPFYRLVGPFRSPSAPPVIKTEIWDTIIRRGILGNLLMGVIPMLFYGSINLLAYALEMSLSFLCN